MKSDEEKYLAEEKNIFKELLGWLVYILINFWSDVSCDYICWTAYACYRFLDGNDLE